MNGNHSLNKTQLQLAGKSQRKCVKYKYKIPSIAVVVVIAQENGSKTLQRYDV